MTTIEQCRPAWTKSYFWVHGAEVSTDNPRVDSILSLLLHASETGSKVVDALEKQLKEMLGDRVNASVMIRPDDGTNIPYFDVEVRLVRDAGGRPVQRLPGTMAPVDGSVHEFHFHCSTVADALSNELRARILLLTDKDRMMEKS